MRISISDRLELVLSMCIFGTIGAFRRWIPIPSGTLALFRSVIAVICLVGVLFLKKGRLDMAAAKKNVWLLLASGICCGMNWILLFEAYRFTSVSIATVCYYMSPIFVILFSPLVLKERITLKKTVCVLAALLGVTILSGIFQSGLYGIRGVLLALGSAALYSCIIFLNKFIRDIPGFDRTIWQLLIAAAATLPYVLVNGEFQELTLTPSVVILLLVLGVIHTGLAYYLYFGSISGIPAQTVAILGYIDPLVAILTSVLLLGEPMTLPTIIGCILVLGAAILSELPGRKRTKTT